MDFTLEREHQMMRTLLREFAEQEIKPLAQQADEEEALSPGLLEKMAQYGFFGIPVPRELGGQGCDMLSYILCVEEFSRVCASTGVTVETHTSLACEPLLQLGTQAQKERYLPPLAQGKTLGAFGLTEPNAGTDAAGQQTTAVLQGDHYVLNGSKIFISNAAQAGTFIIFAMTDKAKGTKGISAFIVQRDFPGFTIGTKEKKMGIRGASTCELVFQNCLVPAENLLGKEEKGFGYAMQALDGGRVGIAAQALGIAQGAFDETVRYGFTVYASY